MTDTDIRQLIISALRGRVTPISTGAILVDVTDADVIERARKMIWHMVEAGEVKRFKLNGYLAKPGVAEYNFINVYKLVE